MKYFYLTKYSVNGIKSIDKEMSLSFYKKTITKTLDTQNYHVKGIYGMNGSGKSAIINSVDILKNIIMDDDYLKNPFIQKELNELINKKQNQLYLKVEFLCDLGDLVTLHEYQVTIAKNQTDKYIISNESLYQKNALSRSQKRNCIFEITNGEIQYLCQNDNFAQMMIDKTKNLLEISTLSSLYLKNLVNEVFDESSINHFLGSNVLLLYAFSNCIHVCLDQQDTHTDYFYKMFIDHYDDNHIFSKKFFIDYIEKSNSINLLVPQEMKIPQSMFDDFKDEVIQLESFLKLFKTDLNKISIDRKEMKDYYICHLVMTYKDYSISAEFESTGIKKLIKLFVYLKEMVNGKIVFIDEFDSNLHDVYLCALLEYLMNYGKGQLCFTTHNIGPMDILKRNKQSIDFLSTNHKIYSWKNNGHYSPSRLYKDGMIEGSPFNIDAIDFIGVLDSIEEN